MLSRGGGYIILTTNNSIFETHELDIQSVKVDMH